MSYGSGHRYNTRKLIQVLDRFCESEEGGDAIVQLILPDGRNPNQKEFNIREIKLVENKPVSYTHLTLPTTYTV